MDLTQLLPEDVLADVLRCLAPRGLAVSRCVCKAWLTIIDGRRLLRPNLLPLSLGGIFLRVDDTRLPPFFSCPSTGPASCGKLDEYLDTNDSSFALLRQHCNGLLLFYDHVVNPATRQWTRLPPPPPNLLEMDDLYFSYHSYLVFDPTMSSHYEVFIVPHIPYENDKVDPAMEESEWPPSPCVLRVFSSKTGRWKERPVIREGHAMGTLADVPSWRLSRQDHAIYWRGCLYVQCRNDFVTRITLSNDKYQVIKPPTDIEVSKYPGKLHLGKSEHGVYCALIYRSYRLRVWFLNESYGQIEWVLKYDKNLGPMLAHRNYDEQINGPWMLRYNDGDDEEEALAGVKFEWSSDDDNVLGTKEGVDHDEDDNNEARMEEKFVWSSDNGNVLDTEYDEEIIKEAIEWSSDDDIFPNIEEWKINYHGYISFLGFHPYKEVVFLHESNRRGLAYHLNSSKIQDLGNLNLKYYIQYIEASFPYTPCWVGEFPEPN